MLLLSFVVKRVSPFPSASSFSDSSLSISEFLLDFELSLPESTFLIGFGLSFPFFPSAMSGSSGSANSFGS